MECKHPEVEVELIGQDGNIFGLVAITSKALRRAGFKEDADAMQKEVFASGSYDEALAILTSYVEVS